MFCKFVDSSDLCLFIEDFVCLLFLYMVDWKVLSFVLEIIC